MDFSIISNYNLIKTSVGVCMCYFDFVVQQRALFMSIIVWEFVFAIFFFFFLTDFSIVRCCQSHEDIFYSHRRNGRTYVVCDQKFGKYISKSNHFECDCQKCCAKRFHEKRFVKSAVTDHRYHSIG